jgi:hypothetical protein
MWCLCAVYGPLAAQEAFTTENYLDEYLRACISLPYGSPRRRINKFFCFFLFLKKRRLFGNDAHTDPKIDKCCSIFLIGCTPFHYLLWSEFVVKDQTVVTLMLSEELAEWKQGQIRSVCGCDGTSYLIHIPRSVRIWLRVRCGIMGNSGDKPSGSRKIKHSEGWNNDIMSNAYSSLRKVCTNPKIVQDSE